MRLGRLWGVELPGIGRLWGVQLPGIGGKKRVAMLEVARSQECSCP